MKTYKKYQYVLKKKNQKEKTNKMYKKSIAFSKHAFKNKFFLKQPMLE